MRVCVCGCVGGCVCGWVGGSVHMWLCCVCVHQSVTSGLTLTVATSADWLHPSAQVIGSYLDRLWQTEREDKDAHRIRSNSINWRPVMSLCETVFVYNEFTTDAKGIALPLPCMRAQGKYGVPGRNGDHFNDWCHTDMTGHDFITCLSLALLPLLPSSCTGAFALLSWWPMVHAVIQ